MVESQALGNDVCSVIRAMLKRSPREQPAHEFLTAMMGGLPGGTDGGHTSADSRKQVERCRVYCPS